VFRFISDYRLLTFGAILVLMLRFQPQGLFGVDSAALRAVSRVSQRWAGRNGPPHGAGKVGASRGPA
jgi:branched-chain amino acid transport system permease protein